ncbi:MAG: alpha/beta fold hydrolase [Myxococcales bacterium]|nr:alpha/beta fold hydrolase [Myxococcales bacterium]
MPTIRLGEGRAYAYEERGSGTPLLLLHGFPFSSQSFRPQLDSPPKGFRVIAPDHRGFGNSAMKDGPSSMNAMAGDALALLEALKLESAVVGGVSMGGYVAMALARMDPGKVKGLVLIDTQATADDEAGKARREAVAVDVIQNGVGGLVSSMLPKLLAAKTPDVVRGRVEAMMLKQAPEAVAAASRGMATRVDSKDLLARFSGPTLVIVGEHDAITPPAKAKEMADLVSGAQLEVIPEAAHLTNLEQPAAFKRLLEQFATKF